MIGRAAAAGAKANFSELVSRVAHGGDGLSVALGDHTLAAVVSIADLDKIDLAEHSEDPLLGFVGWWGETSEEEIQRIERHLADERTRNLRPPPNLSDG